MGCLGCLGAVGEIDEFVVAEHVGRFFLEDAEHLCGDGSDFGFGVFVAAKFDEVAKGACVGGDEDFCFGGVGQHGSGGLSAPSGTIAAPTTHNARPARHGSPARSASNRLNVEK